MTTDQILHIRGRALEFLRKQFSQDLALGEEAEDYLRIISEHFEMVSDPSAKNMSDRWSNFFKELMQARIRIYNTVPVGTRSLAGDALAAVHIFLWRALEKSQPDFTTHAPEIAMKQYRRYFTPAWLKKGAQTIFEEKRIEAAAFNKTHILDNAHADNQHNMPAEQAKQFSLEKIYSPALYTMTDQIESFINTLQISSEELVSFFGTLINFLTDLNEEENELHATSKEAQEKKVACINSLNQAFTKLLLENAPNDWSTLPLGMIGHGTDFSEKFQDAVRTTYICLSQLINTYHLCNLEEISKNINQSKQAAEENLKSLMKQQDSNPEAIETALRLVNNFNIINTALPPVSNTRINTWLEELQSALRPPIVLLQPPVARISLTAVPATLHSKITVREKNLKQPKLQKP